MFIEHLSEEVVDADHFLKDTEAGKQLDIRRVNDNPKEFFVLFSNFLTKEIIGRRLVREYVKTVNLSMTRNGEVLPFVYKNLINTFIQNR